MKLPIHPCLSGKPWETPWAWQQRQPLYSSLCQKFVQEDTKHWLVASWSSYCNGGWNYRRDGRRTQWHSWVFQPRLPILVEDWWTDRAQHNDDEPRVLDVFLGLIENSLKLGTHVLFPDTKEFRKDQQKTTTKKQKNTPQKKTKEGLCDVRCWATAPQPKFPKRFLKTPTKKQSKQCQKNTPPKKQNCVLVKNALFVSPYFSSENQKSRKYYKIGISAKTQTPKLGQKDQRILLGKFCLFVEALVFS